MSNARKLKALMVTHSIDSDRVARLIGVSLYTVRAWLVSPESGKHRPMKDRDLDYLKLKLLEKKLNAP